ncbi:MAG: AAA family ATPase, partial [Armatimonadetes bacterium]|nr:AAA family ATPase [Armatimonadota bacterium]
MIKRLFVDNYKCFVNFDTYFGSQTLIVGENGVGKTTLFEVLDALRRFMTGIEYVSDIFPESSLTRWQQAYVQTFEVDVQEQADTFRYHLEAEHEKGTGKCRVISEWLTENDNLLFRFENSKAYLYRDNYTVGPEYPASWSRSGLGSVAESADNTKLTRFRERM